jgi:hypothetical protein
MLRLGLAKALAGTALAVSASLSLAQSYPNVPVTTDGTAQSQENPNYGVCHGTDPSCYHNWGVTRASDSQFPNGKVLLFTRTAGPRHASLGSALAAGLNPPLGPNNNTQRDLVRLLNAEGIGVDYTETVTNLSNLNRYRAVIFFSNSRDVLWDHGRAVNPAFAVSTTTSAYLDAAKVNLRQYMRAGGGFVAVHNAHGTEYNWPWYEGLLGNSNYYDHGQYQLGNFVITSADSSTTPVGAPGTAVPFKDEWYNLVPFPTDVKFLATVDENTLATKHSTHPGFPSFHPVAWCQYYDGGRAWITTLGHSLVDTSDTSTAPSEADFPPAGRAAFQKLLVNGIKSAMGLQPFCEAYGFSGFSGGAANAGSAVQVSFTLSANGSAVPDSNPVTWVKSAPAACNTGLPSGDFQIESVAANAVGKSGEYHLNWKTDKSWAGSCRVLWMLLSDGTVHHANFQLN